MRKIKLTQGKQAIVDDNDFDELNKYKWYTKHQCRNYYVVRHHPLNHGRLIWMHRIIMGDNHGMDIDHINGNGLDNRKINLRFCTRSQNNQNQRMRNKKFKGFSKRDNTYQARITVSGKRIYIGSYRSQIGAALAYNIAAKLYFGDFARLNRI